VARFSGRCPVMVHTVANTYLGIFLPHLPECYLGGTASWLCVKFHVRLACRLLPAAGESLQLRAGGAANLQAFRDEVSQARDKYQGLHRHYTSHFASCNDGQLCSITQAAAWLQS
jgi:hypothetical protein